jgi:hypothetical protein
MVHTGDKLRVAFLFQGTSGCGKGAWFNYTVAQIFGRLYCTQIQHGAFIKEFNTWLEHNYCLLVDEVEADFTSKSDALARVLKQVIGDRWIAVEGKGTDIKNGKINANLFFATNKRNGLTLEASDRRFIIGDWQDENVFEQDWWTDDDKMVAELESEVPQFVGYLKSHQVDMDKLNRVVKNEARQILIDLSKTNTTMFFDAIKNKNWTLVAENLVEFVDVNPWDKDKYDYKNALKIVTHPPKDRIHRDDLRILYNNIFQTNKNANMFTRMCNLNGIKIETVKINGTNQQGFRLK